MKNIKMIVTDLDRTLLRKDKTISDYTKVILNKCHKSGFQIVFATARPERVTRQWQVCPSSYVIANNGATITHGRVEIQNIIIPEVAKHSIIKRFISEESITGICAEIGDFLYSNDTDFSTWVTVLDTDTGWNPVYSDFTTPVTEHTCKFSVECSDREVLFDILQDYPELQIFPNSGEQWYQITHKSVSKFNAILYLAELNNIQPQDIIAFGDDYNDIEMLKKCGVGVAVENAIAEAKKVADYVCDSNDCDGVAKFIEKYLLFVPYANEHD